jgi:hypothetical protein
MVENPVEAISYFARGFHEGGMELIENIDGMSPDYAVIPIVFLYRHAMELALKGATWDADDIARATRRTPSCAPSPEKCGHSLVALLPFFRHVIAQFKWQWDEAAYGSYDNAERLITELDAVDAGSYKFRYPMKRDGAPSECADFTVNVVHFAKSLNPVLDGIFDFCFYLEGVRDAELLG